MVGMKNSQRAITVLTVHRIGGDMTNIPPEFLDNLSEMEDTQDFEPDVFDAAMEAEDVTRFEGEHGLDSLNKLASMLGYNQEPFYRGSPLENMLRDNSGMIEAMFTWVRENLSQDQIELLEAYVPEDDPDEDG